MNVHLRGELTRQCVPGDIITIDGIFLPTPYNDSYHKAGLLADTYIEAMKITQHKKSYGSYHIESELSEKIQELNAGIKFFIVLLCFLIIFEILRGKCLYKISSFYCS